MSDDVVAHIDACEIADGVGDIIMPRSLVLRARDEIVALRDPRSCTCHPDERPDPCRRRYALSECMAAYNQVRAEALEEAAQEAGKWATGKAARSAIRALKDKRDE